VSIQEKAFYMSIRARVLSLAIALMVIVPAAAKAQMSPVSAGIKGGINSASLSSDADENDDLRRLTAGVGGIFIGRDINKNVGLQFEALYSMRGAKAEGGDAKIKLNYIDVPVLVRFGATSASGIKAFAFTGPQASYNVKAEAEFLGETQDLEDDIEKFDLGWTVGAGVDVNRFTVDARYTMGLMNIAKDETETVKNRTFTVMVGIRLK
jgi:opacity protein-like surface antigen